MARVATGTQDRKGFVEYVYRFDKMNPPYNSVVTANNDRYGTAHFLQYPRFSKSVGGFLRCFYCSSASFLCFLSLSTFSKLSFHSLFTHNSMWTKTTRAHHFYLPHFCLLYRLPPLAILVIVRENKTKKIKFNGKIKSFCFKFGGKIGTTQSPFCRFVFVVSVIEFGAPIDVFPYKHLFRTFIT